MSLARRRRWETQDLVRAVHLAAQASGDLGSALPWGVSSRACFPGTCVSGRGLVQRGDLTLHQEGDLSFFHDDRKSVTTAGRVSRASTHAPAPAEIEGASGRSRGRQRLPPLWGARALKAKLFLPSDLRRPTACGLRTPVRVPQTA